MWFFFWWNTPSTSSLWYYHAWTDDNDTNVDSNDTVQVELVGAGRIYVDEGSLVSFFTGDTDTSNDGGSFTLSNGMQFEKDMRVRVTHKLYVNREDDTVNWEFFDILSYLNGDKVNEAKWYVDYTSDTNQNTSTVIIEFIGDVAQGDRLVSVLNQYDSTGDMKYYAQDLILQELPKVH